MFRLVKLVFNETLKSIFVKFIGRNTTMADDACEAITYKFHLKQYVLNNEIETKNFRYAFHIQ